MSPDPYAACPCGSGKKFKWCCQPIYPDIERAFELHNGGQHEAALQVLDRLTQAHPANPEAWGRKAQLLSLGGQIDEAEAALQKAFDINPNYPFGFLLRGSFRQQEGEPLGALMLYRKAAEAYSPDSHTALSQIHELIADLELLFNRPVAAHVALQRAVHFDPANAELRQAFEAAFGKASTFPRAATRTYALRSPTSPSPEWQAAIAGATTGRLSDALHAFRAWTERHPDDPAGWFNLGLVQAWLGDNPAAVASLGKYVELESEESAAADAWALVEVLRCAQGMEADADAVEHRVVFQVRQPRGVLELLQHWHTAQRLVPMQNDPERGILSALVLEEMPALVLSGTAAPPARLAAYLLVASGVLQVWQPRADAVGRVATEVRTHAGTAVGESRQVVGPIAFADVTSEAVVYPAVATTELDAEHKVREHAQAFFEETWVNRPLKGLSGLTPETAAGQKGLRKKLIGIVRFLEDCSQSNACRLYDFDRLRQRLGLPTEKSPPGNEVEAPTKRDLSAASAADLAVLDAGALAVAELEQAYRKSLELDSRDQATRFAEAIVARPADAGPQDRYPYFSHLIQAAQTAKDFDAALSHVDAAMKADCEVNEGRRRNEYELRRGQVLAKKGDADEARDVFQKLLDRTPGDSKVAGTAAEAMLGLKRGPAARSFAEHGLAQARAQNNRDSEGYFLELVEAARKQGG